MSLLSISLFGASSPGELIRWGADISGEDTGAKPIGYATNRVVAPNHILTNVVAAAAGQWHGLALLSDGTVAGWGGNSFGQTLGYSMDSAYRTNGIVIIAGHVLRNVVAISAGQTHSLALKRDGSVAEWGALNDGARIDVPSELSNVVAIAAGWGYDVAIVGDGTVVGWGVRRVPAGLSNIVAIAAGQGPFSPSLALRRDGIVVEWRPGVEFEGGRIVASNAVAISAGGGHSLALERDGTVFGWGENASGEATGIPTSPSPINGESWSNGLVIIHSQTLNNVTAVAAGTGYSLALKGDGTLVAWGARSWHTTDVPSGLSNVVAIAAGGNFCLAITTNSPGLMIK